MTTTLLANPTLSLLEKAAAFGERRHDILAGNIANISTPTYRMRDLPAHKFQQALQKAVAELRTPSKVQAGSPAETTQPTTRSLEDFFPKELFQAEQKKSGNLTFQDAGNRSIEHQTMKLTKNSMLQNFLLEVLRFQMNSLQSVISERPV